MSRKRGLIIGLIALILISALLGVYALLVGTPRHPMTVEEADTLVRRELPLGASVRQVKIWLDTNQIEHGDFTPYHANGSDGEILSIIRDTHRSLFENSDIQTTFAFDKQHRLKGHTVHEVITGL